MFNYPYFANSGVRGYENPYLHSSYHPRTSPAPGHHVRPQRQQQQYASPFLTSGYSDDEDDYDVRYPYYRSASPGNAYLEELRRREEEGRRRAKLEEERRVQEELARRKRQAELEEERTRQMRRFSEQYRGFGRDERSRSPLQTGASRSPVYQQPFSRTESSRPRSHSPPTVSTPKIPSTSSPTPEQAAAAASKIQTFYRVHRALATTKALSDRFEAEKAAFHFPSRLDFIPPGEDNNKHVTVDVPEAYDSPSDTDVPNDEDVPSPQVKLAYTHTNAPVHAYAEALSRILTALDAVESWGVRAVRERRREVVRKVEQEAGRVDRMWKGIWEMHMRKPNEEAAEMEVEAEKDDGTKTDSEMPVDGEVESQGVMEDTLAQDDTTSVSDSLSSDVVLSDIETPEAVSHSDSPISSEHEELSTPPPASEEPSHVDFVNDNTEIRVQHDEDLVVSQKGADPIPLAKEDPAEVDELGFEML